jgi:3-oxoacyl-ACP reductase-like protein
LHPDSNPAFNAFFMLTAAGQKRSKSNPLLMLETASKGKPVLKFDSQDDREAVVAAITQATEALQQAALSAVSGAAGEAPAAAAGAAAAAGGQQQQQVLGSVRLTPEQRQGLLASNK